MRDTQGYFITLHGKRRARLWLSPWLWLLLWLAGMGFLFWWGISHA